MTEFTRRDLLAFAAAGAATLDVSRAGATAMSDPITTSFALTRPSYVGQSHLAVADLDMMADFYKRMLGFKEFERSASGVLLGAGDRPFLTLSSEKDIRRGSRRSAGLFHNAFLVPNRTELARWLRHAAHSGVALDGASDHLVSEAIYLSDPEGNGIEVYRDRSPMEWTYKPDGQVEMSTLHMDLQALYDSVPDQTYGGMADGTAIGHIHLQVGNIPKADAFYRDVLGLKLMATYPGAHFYASGAYHHHIAANVWNSNGASPRETGLTGLADYTLTFNDKAALDAAVKAAEALDIKAVSDGDAVKVIDPFGIGVRLTA